MDQATGNVIPEVAYALLDARNFGHLVTLMPDGAPQSTVIWIERDGNTVLFNTAKGRVKHRNMLRDPRVALSIHDQDNPSVYLQIRGRAEILESGGTEHTHKMSNKYKGCDYTDIDTDPPRILVRVIPDHVHYHSH